MHVNSSSLLPENRSADQQPGGYTPPARTAAPRFLSVRVVAKSLGMSKATLYRAIHAGEFPAVKIRGRYVVPSKVLDAMEDASLSAGSAVDAADWVPEEARALR